MTVRGEGMASGRVTLDEEKKRSLSKTCERIVEALGEVADVALERLSSGPKSAPIDVFAHGTNSIVGGPSPTKRLVAGHDRDRESLRRFEREPFVARLVVQWEDDGRRESLYITRASAAVLGSRVPDVKLVTYASAVGRLAEFDVGETVAVRVGDRDREVTIEERVTLRPQRREGEWDAIDDSFEFDSWTVALESIRRYLAEIGEPRAIEDVPDLLGAILGDAGEAALVLERLRRGVIEHQGLRDQPILDRYQGEVFRMPLDRRLVLLGPPGTGKTTTLIRRLAQKRTPEALTEAEGEMLRAAGLAETFVASPDSWAMFSPTELLKLYLRDAFNREGVPAGPSNLKTWDRERIALGRNVLHILRASDGRGFQLDEGARTVADPTSEGVRLLYEEFAAHFQAGVVEQSSKALEQLVASGDSELLARVRAAVGRRRDGEPLSLREIAGLVDGAAELQSEVRRLGEEASDEERRIGNRLLAAHPGLFEEIVAAIPALIGDDNRDEDEEDDDDEEETTAPPTRDDDERRRAVALLLTALRVRARATAERRGRVGGRSGRVLALLAGRVPSDEALSGLGARLLTRARLRSLILAPRAFVMNAPRDYARFRRRALREGRFYNQEAAEAIGAKRLAPCEVDLLILTMFDNARRLMEAGPASLRSGSSAEWLETIRSEYLAQVFVDEATDFSAVELACMAELAHPRLKSWFACGDIDQRITLSGIRSRDEFEWVARVAGGTIELREVAIGYRQSRRLRELARALSSFGVGQGSGLQAPETGDDVDIAPLLGEFLNGERLARWLADRIVEVERAVGRLPSIAVFVTDEESIDPLAEALKPLLAVHNIPVAGLKDGRVLGESLEVRIFNVQHIKGLEFEAVFFVGIDRLATRIPDLVDRYFYVGASRAATYLAVTSEGELPRNLEPVRAQFEVGRWN